MNDILVQVQHCTDEDMKKTFEMLFEKWLEYLKDTNIKQNSIARHSQRYHKFIEGAKWTKKPIRKVKVLEIEKWADAMIAEKEYFTIKEWKNIKTILYGVYHLAIRKGIVSNNIIKDVKLTSRLSSVKRKAPEDQVFSPIEEQIIIDECYDEISQSEHIAPLAILFNFYMGLRVGELLGLKWSDIQGNKIHIQRQYGKETANNGITKYQIYEYTKTSRSGSDIDAGDRILPIPEKATKILELARKRSTGEFIFEQNGVLTTSSMINHRLYKYQRNHGIINVKSSHAIRRTYASKLSYRGIDRQSIQTLLGHQNIETTNSYIYDLENSTALLNKLNEVL